MVAKNAIPLFNIIHSFHVIYPILLLVYDRLGFVNEVVVVVAVARIPLNNPIPNPRLIPHPIYKAPATSRLRSGVYDYGGGGWVAHLILRAIRMQRHIMPTLRLSIIF